jgi:intracellular multiplication protein IcmE
MASKLSEMFSKANARSRVFMIVGAVLGVVGIIAIGTKMLGGGTKASGHASVAGAPSLQSVPGGQLTPEYYRALMQANAQTAQQAQVSGASAVPTLVNAPGAPAAAPAAAPSGDCTLVCPSEDNPDISNEVNNLLKAGKLAPADANRLLDMAKRNVPVSEYADYLNNLVKEGKLSPDAARKLLAIYEKQHANATAEEGARTMDAMIRSGKLPLDVAAHLLDMQKRNVGTAEYADELNRLVREGKISPETAAQLLAQYTQNQAHQSAEKGANMLKDMVSSGEITQDVANDLADLQKRNVPVSQYEAELNRLVAEGKMTPAAAAKLLAQYQSQRTNLGPAGTLDGIVTNAEARGAQELNDMVGSGKLSREAADDILALQAKHLTPQQYAAAIDQLMREGKIPPDLADKLKANALRLSGLVASGKISQDTANALQELSNRNVSPQDYNAAIDELVREGKIPPDVAAELKAQYAADHAGESQGAADQAMDSSISAMAASGKITTGTANSLEALQARHLSAQDYNAAIDQMVREGKLSADAAAQLKSQYAAHSAAVAASGVSDINSLVANGQLSPDGAALLSQLQRNQVSPDEYNAAIDKLVREGKLTPAAAARLKANYARIAALRDEATKLTQMQANNVSAAEYSAELKRAVAAGLITPEQAAALQAEYNAMTAPVPVPITPNSGNAPTVQTNVPGGESFAGLQKRLATRRPPGQVTRPGAQAPSGPDQAAQFAAAEAAAEAEAQKEQQQHIQDLMTQMTSQATALISSWQAPVMQAKNGSAESKGSTTTTTTTTEKNGRGSSASAGGASGGANDSPPLLKAGTILFAVLTTAVDSDYPDTPVMATIVSGVFKGATLLGKLSLAQGQNKVSLNFTLMNRDDWPHTKSVTAFAIDPDTARTVLASSVNNHYMLRYGTMFASSFVTGYANGISQSGSTTSSGIFGTTNTHPQLSPGEKIAVALGQVGTTFGTALANFVNTPVTVKVNSGVGLGILFMADVPSADAPTASGTGSTITQAPPIAVAAATK